MKTFEEYDRDNPDIWQKFQRFAIEAKTKGFKRYSAKGIFEIIRWHTPARKGIFKIDNNYHADYARKMMYEFPSFVGFFETRKQTKMKKLIVVFLMVISLAGMSQDTIYMNTGKYIPCKVITQTDSSLIIERTVLNETYQGYIKLSDVKKVAIQSREDIIENNIHRAGRAITTSATFKVLGIATGAVALIVGSPIISIGAGLFYVGSIFADYSAGARLKNVK